MQYFHSKTCFVHLSLWCLWVKDFRDITDTDCTGFSTKYLIQWFCLASWVSVELLFSLNPKPWANLGQTLGKPWANLGQYVLKGLSYHVVLFILKWSKADTLHFNVAAIVLFQIECAEPHKYCDMCYVVVNCRRFPDFRCVYTCIQE